MTLDGAIKELTTYPFGAIPDKSVELNQAILLGIEALGELRKLRNSGILGAWKPLLGETEE